MFKYILFICLIFINLIGCKPKNESELCGTYIADYKIAREKIILYEDKTYLQEVIIKATSRVDTAKGKWSYNSNSGYVILDKNYMIVLDESGKLDPKYFRTKQGSSFLLVDKYFCWIILGVIKKLNKYIRI
jgi:hypothetical protein